MWKTKVTKTILFACQAILCHALKPLKDNLFASYHILLGQLPSSLRSIPFAKTPQAEEQPPATASPRPEPKQSPQPKRQHSSPDPQGDMSIDETSPWPCRKDHQAPREERLLTGSLSLMSSHADAGLNNLSHLLGHSWPPEMFL